MLAIGLMSGTSLDGIDAALIEIDGDATRVAWKLLAFESMPYSAAQRMQLREGIESGTAESLCRLHADLGEWLASAALRVAAKAAVAMEDVDVIGSHGQTVWHCPPTRGARGATLQIGCPATIAERTRTDVVNDFRSRDVAAGGEGAPLVPWADRLLFARSDGDRVLINIGGMANLTWVPQHGRDAGVLAFDTGPGNVLIDAAVEVATNGEATFDAGGAMARGGSVDDELLTRLLAHAFFSSPPPRSTGREQFGRAYIEDLLRGAPDRTERARLLIPTLTELTARSIADAIMRFVPAADADFVVTGGGAKNTWLMERLSALLSPAVVKCGDDVGINADAKEAVVFAALAWAHVRRIPGNVIRATGAAGPRVLGSFTPGAEAMQLNEELDR